jgi:ATP-grasp ribosomal peptide maturase
MPEVVLVVTDRFDVTADHVVTELDGRGVPVFRFDTADFPRRLSASARLDTDHSGSLRTPSRSVTLAEVGAVYYRRPSIYQVDPELSEPDAKWAVKEARFGFGGLLSSLPGWLNHPADIARCEYKPVQYAAARRAGLRLPPTLPTSSGAEARAFAAEVGPIVYKPLSGIAYKHEHGRDFIYTQHVEASELDDAAIAATTCLFQQRQDKAYEVRLTVVDGQCFAARIDANSERARIDWRADYDSLSYTPIPTPAPIQTAVRSLLSLLRLRFAAIDFIITPTDEWVFIGDVNPNGQWAWISELTPRIACAIADALQERTTPP